MKLEKIPSPTKGMTPEQVRDWVSEQRKAMIAPPKPRKASRRKQGYVPGRYAYIDEGKKK